MWIVGLAEPPRVAGMAKLNSRVTHGSAAAGQCPAAARSQPIALPAEPDEVSELRRHWLLLGLERALRTRLLAMIEARRLYRVTVVEDAAEVRRLVKCPGSPVDGVVMDAGPTETEGGRLCRQLRWYGTRIPLMVMGDWTNLHAVVSALEAGASDFMPRDYPPNLIATRMRCHLRNYEDSENATFPLGSLRLHPASRTLVEPASGRRIRLTGTESRMLHYLLEAGGAAVQGDELAGQVWGRPEPRDGPLEPLVKQLQQKIGGMGGRVLPQRMGAGGGYKLVRVRHPHAGIPP